MDTYSDVLATDDLSVLEMGVVSGDTDDECDQMSQDPISVTIRSGTIVDRATIDGTCGPWTTNVARRKHKSFVIQYSNQTDQHASLLTIALRGKVDGRRVRFRYSFVWHGKTLRHGTIIGRTRYAAGHDVYEGTDGFINYCINESQEIRSQDGSLYCWYPGFLKRSWRWTT